LASNLITIAETGTGTLSTRSRGGTGYLVKRDAKNIKIASRVDRAIHSPGLFRSHVRKCSRDELGRFGYRVLALKARSNPKAHEPKLARRGIHQDIARLYILMNQLPFVQPAECRCEIDSEA
jgi:hypothetical protein